MNILNLLQYVALITGVLAVLLGAIAMILPTKMSDSFGIPINGIASSYVSSLGVRDIFIGFVMLMLYFNEAWKIVAYTSFMISAVAFVDFIIVFKNGSKKKSLTHLVGVIIFIIRQNLLLLITTLKVTNAILMELVLKPLLPENTGMIFYHSEFYTR